MDGRLPHRDTRVVEHAIAQRRGCGFPGSLPRRVLPVARRPCREELIEHSKPDVVEWFSRGASGEVPEVCPE